MARGFAVVVMDHGNGYSGSLKVGLTQTNPATLAGQPLPANLSDVGNTVFWNSRVVAFTQPNGTQVGGHQKEFPFL